MMQVDMVNGFRLLCRLLGYGGNVREKALLEGQRRLFIIVVIMVVVEQGAIDIGGGVHGFRGRVKRGSRDSLFLVGRQTHRLSLHLRLFHFRLHAGISVALHQDLDFKQIISDRMLSTLDAKDIQSPDINK